MNLPLVSPIPVRAAVNESLTDLCQPFTIPIGIRPRGLFIAIIQDYMLSWH